MRRDLISGIPVAPTSRIMPMSSLRYPGGRHHLRYRKPSNTAMNFGLAHYNQSLRLLLQQR